MKKLSYGLTVLLFFSCTEKKGNPLTVGGTVKNSTARTIYLEQLPAGGDQRPIIVDSATLDAKGGFSMQTSTTEESMYGLRLAQDKFPLALLVNDSKKITVDIDMLNTAVYTVKGSDASKGLFDFSNELNRQFTIVYDAERRIDSLSKIQTADTMARKSIDSTVNAYYLAHETAAEEIKEYTGNFIEKASSPVLVLYAYSAYQNTAERFNMKGFSRTERAALITKAASRFPDSKTLSEQKQKLPAATAAEINLPDTSGRNLALSSFRGKYVLVDFWASWCGPCRQENPNVVAAYRQFKDKNFTILGVSLDRSKDAWQKAIAEDGLTWNHVSDLKYWESAVVPLYGLNSIPYNVLVDPKGNIIAEGLRGEQLIQTLNSVLK